MRCCGIFTDAVSGNLFWKTWRKARQAASVLYNDRIESGIFESSLELISDGISPRGEEFFSHEKKEKKIKIMIKLDRFFILPPLLNLTYE
jgi:hypothetical protein